MRWSNLPLRMYPVLFFVSLSILIQPVSTSLAASQVETGNPMIAFVTRNWDTRTLTITLSDPSGTNVIPFITNARENDLYNPVWSPDGTQLAFSANRPRAFRNNIYVINGDGSNLHIASGHASTSGPMIPAWSPDSTQLVYAVSYSGLFDFFKVNADGTDEEQLELEDFAESFYEMWLVWSPDGTQIAFNAYLESVSTTVYVMNADGTNPQPFPVTAPDGSTYTRMAWSPDGEQVLLYGVELYSGGSESLAVADADGSNLQEIETGSLVNVSSASWSPDGSQIVFIANDPVFEAPGDLWIVNADGSNLHRLNIDGDVAAFFGTSWALIPEDVVFPSTPINLAEAS